MTVLNSKIITKSSVYDLKTSQEIKLPERTNLLSGNVHNNILYYRDNTNPMVLMTFDLNSKVVNQITLPGSFNNTEFFNPQIANNRLILNRVNTDASTGNRTLRMGIFDLGHPNTIDDTPLLGPAGKDPWINSNYPTAISDTKAVWVNNSSGISSLQIKDLLYGMDDPIGASALSKSAIAIHSNRLLWADTQGVFSYTIPPPPLPVFTPVSTIKTIAGRTLRFPINATDPSGRKLTLSVAGTGPSNLNSYMPGATFTDNGNGTGNFSWAIPNNLPAKIYHLNFTATNTRGIKSSLLVTVNLTTPTVTGYIDSIVSRGDGSYSVLGWACATYLNQPIDIHLYLGGQAGSTGSSFYVSGKANLPSEPAVAAACNTTGTNHRFNLRLGADGITAYGGRPFAIHGISPIGAANLAITNRNNLRIPTITYAMTSAASNDILPGWPVNNVIDGNTGTNYSSSFFATANNDRGTFLAAWMGQLHDVKKILLTARLYNGQIQAFPPSYDIYLGSPDNTRWDLIGTFTNQPDASGKVTITLNKYYRTAGVLIIPKTLGVDAYGNHYFQMAEIKLSQ